MICRREANVLLALGLVLVMAPSLSPAQVTFDPGPIRSIRPSEASAIEPSSRGELAPQALELLTDTVGARVQIFPRSRDVAIVVLPAAGSAFLPRSIVEHLVHAGYSVVSVEGDELVPGSPDTWMLALYDMTSRGIAAARLTRDTFTPRCLVIAGVSLGGFAAIPVAAVSRADAVVAALAGGELEELAKTSEVGGLGEVGTPDKRSSRDAIRAIDPMTWARHIPRGRSLVIRAMWDKVVPWRSVQSLLQALRDPALVTLPASHETSVLFHSYASKRIVSFIQDACLSNRSGGR